MLAELNHARQAAGERYRRWFMDDYFDLIVWYDPDDEIYGFQLCYDKPGRERVITWKKDAGFSHEAVDDGEGRPGKYKMSPIIRRDGRGDGVKIARDFTRRSRSLDV